jgi:hypothetical protein
MSVSLVFVPTKQSVESLLVSRMTQFFFVFETTSLLSTDCVFLGALKVMNDQQTGKRCREATPCECGHSAAGDCVYERCAKCCDGCARHKTPQARSKNQERKRRKRCEAELERRARALPLPLPPLAPGAGALVAAALGSNILASLVCEYADEDDLRCGHCNCRLVGEFVDEAVRSGACPPVHDCERCEEPMHTKCSPEWSAAFAQACESYSEEDLATAHKWCLDCVLSKCVSCEEALDHHDEVCNNCDVCVCPSARVSAPWFEPGEYCCSTVCAQVDAPLCAGSCELELQCSDDIVRCDVCDESENTLLHSTCRGEESAVTIICQACVPEYSDKRQTITAALHAQGLQWRDDSRLMREFCVQEFDAPEREADDIASIVQRMSFARLTRQFCDWADFMRQAILEQEETFSAGYFPDVPLHAVAERLAEEWLGQKFAGAQPWLSGELPSAFRQRVESHNASSENQL